MRKTWAFYAGNIVVLTFLFLVALFPLTDAAAAEHPILYLFWGKGCPHCAEEKTFLEQLHERYPELEMRWFELWDHPEFQELVDALSENYDVKAASVPLTFLGEMAVVGFLAEEITGIQIEKQVVTCLQEGCIDALDKVDTLPIVEQIRDEASRKEPDNWQLFPSSVETDEEK